MPERTADCQQCKDDAAEMRAMLEDQGVSEPTIKRMVALCKCRTCASRPKGSGGETRR